MKTITHDSKDVFFFIPHTHWEGAVFKTREAYLAMGLPNILRALKLLKQYPNYRFTLDQACYVKPFLERHPEEEAVFRQFVAEDRLAIVGIDQEAMQEAEDACLNVLLKARERLLERDPKFAERVREKGELELVTVGIHVDDYAAQELKPEKVPLTEENIEDLFQRCGHALGVGEDLHHKFWQRLYDPSDQLRPKLELHEILKDSATLQKLQQVASRKFSELYQRNNFLIGELPTSHQEPYNRLAGAGKEPETVTHKLPSEIVVRKGERAYQHHLYSDKSGEFWVELNSWERVVLDEETKREGFVGWLRNIDRKDWAIAVPYDDRGKKPFYPDFVVVRRERGKLVADLIDPHNSKMDDTWCKAKGLAEYADDHDRQFGRLEIVIVEKGVLKRMDMNNPEIRKKAKKFQSNNDVDAIFV